MYWSKTFIPTLKEVPREAETVSHQLMLRAGLVRMLMSGVYSYLPLGLRALNKIENIIRQEMNAAGADELLLPSMQPVELWQRSGRDREIGEVMIRFVDRRGRNICLGPTHEEVITELVKSHVSSYRQLPLILYQIQTKFRDEIRPRFGLIRACEFIMKDAYSFDKDEAGLERNYKAMYGAYLKIFQRLGLDILVVEADPGVMGGNLSHEFMAPAEDGEDIVLLCPKCSRTFAFKDGSSDLCFRCQVKLDQVHAIEVGHIFKLGAKYSAVLGANFVDADGKQKPIVMGCYGIGVSRLISAIIEQRHDKDGIVWPAEVSPYQVLLVPIDPTDAKIMQEAEDIYKRLKRSNVEVLLDDRDERAGVKFKDADLLGIRLQVIIGKESLQKRRVELKIRKSNKRIVKAKAQVLKEIARLLKNE